VYNHVTYECAWLAIPLRGANISAGASTAALRASLFPVFGFLWFPFSPLLHSAYGFFLSFRLMFPSPIPVFSCAVCFLLHCPIDSIILIRLCALFVCLFYSHSLLSRGSVFFLFCFPFLIAPFWWFLYCYSCFLFRFRFPLFLFLIL
jgi:hypothetical protein